MTSQVFWQTEGEGSDLVLIHGWGMNGAVWQQLLNELKAQYRVHVVDLPGYGHSTKATGYTLTEMADVLLKNAPDKAVWLGWSLGGLVATQIALQAPERVSQLITVASSPKFAAEGRWRGIKPQVLSDFSQQLVDDFQLTVERFMALQAMGSPTARKDVKRLKEAVFSRPLPEPDALMAGLRILAEVDLRDSLSALTVPMLRMYGRLDGLVPAKVASDMDSYAPNSEKVVFHGASHAPFLSDFEEFCGQLKCFINSHSVVQ